MMVSVGTFLYVVTIHILPEVFLSEHVHGHEHFDDTSSSLSSNKNRLIPPNPEHDDEYNQGAKAKEEQVELAEYAGPNHPTADLQMETSQNLLMS